MNEYLKIVITAEVAKAKEKVKAAKQEIKQFSQKVKEAKKDVSASFKKIGENAATMAKTIGSAIKTASVTIAALGTSILGIVKGTEEYRNQQAQLQTAFQTAGASAEAATATYNSLYRVLGDGGQAQEAAQHLAKLTQNSEHLAEWGTICQGVYSTFGASLPIEGLTEAVNHTAKLGEVQGSLADALEWSGINVEEYNKKLAECSTEAEREALIRQTLNGLYSEAAANYEKNNAQILAQRDAQAALQAKLAAVGTALAPVVTAFTSFAADALALVEPYITKLAETALPQLKELLDSIIPTLESAAVWIKEHSTLLATIATVIGTVVAALTLYNTVAAIKAAMDAAEVVTMAGLVTAWMAKAAAMMAALAPYLLIVAAIGLLVAGFLYLWNNCEGFRAFWLNLWEQLKTVFAAFVESLQPVINSIVNMFVQAWEMIKVVWDFVQPFFAALWESIKVVFSVVAEVLGNFFSAAWEAIKLVWDVVTDYFRTIFNTIAVIFSVVKDVFSGNFEAAWTGVKAIFKGWGNFFQGLWSNVTGIFSVVGSFFTGVFNTAVSNIKNVFSPLISFFSGVWDSIFALFGSVGTTVGNAIKGAVSGAVNAVLSTAAGLINGFIGAINAAISVINAIPGVYISPISKLSIPAMAKGGVVESATLAEIGENGTEAVVPLENNLEWLDKLAGMLNDRMGGSSGPIVLQVDGKTFGQISCDSINSLTRQRGEIPLVMA